VGPQADVPAEPAVSVTALPGRLKSAFSRWWIGVRRSQRWFDHVVRAWNRYKGNSGDYLAGAITYFSFLALFPVILLGVSIAAFVLKAHPDALQTLLDNVEKNAPGGLGSTIKTAIDTAIKARAGVGLIGLVGTLLAGLGWVANLRLATALVWGTGKFQRPFAKAKLADATILVGLGLGLLVSVALTAGGTRLSDLVLRHTGLHSVPGSSFLAPVVGIVLAIAADVLIFGFLLLRLPRASVPRGLGLRGALLAAVGFEVLKIVGTLYLARVSQSPAASAFGSILGVLVFLNLVFRFLLFCVAWIATGLDPYDSVAGENLADAADIARPPDQPPAGQPAPAPAPVAVAGALIGAGAAVGAGTMTAARWWWRRARRRGTPAG
jgi:membrane protein